MIFKSELFIALMNNHQGIRNAITQKEYSKLYQKCDAKTFCEVVRYLRLDNAPIGSGLTGYYYITTEAERDATIAYLENKVIKQNKVVRAMKKRRKIVRSGDSELNLNNYFDRG